MVTEMNIPLPEYKITTKNLDLFYGLKQILHRINLSIRSNQVTALIGPSGCGKSSFLRCLNRMNDTVEGCRIKGQVFLEKRDIYDLSLDVVSLRAKVGMVFQKPTPFPKSMYDNIAYGVRIHGLAETRGAMDFIVEKNLRHAGLWDEVKDRLHESAMGLSGGQQQRLCIARALAVNPEVILMDEPCSALDPIATAIIEELLDELRTKYTIIMVTHSMQQAARISQYTAFFHMGHIVEYGETAQIFTCPQLKQTQDYITGRFG